MGRAFLFALTAALNPTLLTATTVMLLLPSPKRLMLGYLAGALTTGILLGVAIVEWLSGSGAVSDTKHTVAPGIDLALGLIALIAAFVIRSGRHHRSKEKSEKPKKTPRWQQALSGGSARTTYVVGLLLSFPGASYLASLTEISRQGYGAAGVVAAVVAVNAVMLVLLEVPLLSFAVAPEWTARTIERLKGWLAVNGVRAASNALIVIGVLLIVRALVTAAS
jgi:hypothetical protein